MTRRLVLLGGGHAHLRVMAELARRPLPGWDVCLVTPSATQIYSGMLPGWIAGHYELKECSIDLQTWASGAGVSLQLGECRHIDLAGHGVKTSTGIGLEFDALSIDVGSAPNAQLAGHGDPNVAAVRPLENLVDSWRRVMNELGSSCARFDLMVVGGGAGSVELALAARHRAMRDGWSHLHVALAGGEQRPWSAAPAGVGRRIEELLRQRCIAWHGGRRAIGVDSGQVHFDDGESLRFDTCWVATGPASPRWPASSGLETDEEGFVRVTPTLQCVGHAEVFAAGDVASLADSRPKSGVYAVRAGPVLAHNLRAFCTGQALHRWNPPDKALYLLGTGDRNAIALRGDWWWQGRWAWQWKDHIDRRFVEKFRLPERATASPPERTRPCCERHRFWW